MTGSHQQRGGKPSRKARNRFPSVLPVPPTQQVEVPYALRYERSFDEGEAVAWLMSRPEWEETIGAACDAVEAERPKHGPRPSYSTRELEAALFYQVMKGIRTWKSARAALAGDTGERARVALGLDIERKTRCPRDLKRRVGVPSEATMCRHRKRFDYERRLEAYKNYFDALRRLNAQDPQLREGLRILGIDGTAQPTSLQCPKLNRKTGEIVNAPRITCPEGGYRVKDTEKVHGFAAFPLHCVNGLPWAYAHGKVNEDERTAAQRAIEDYRDNVLPHAGPRRLGILTADSGFRDQAKLRPLLHSVGLVPNIHHLSHAKYRESSQKERHEASALQFDIDGRDDWYADGYRELHHRCPNSTQHPVHTYRRIKQGTGGRAITRLEAECKPCKASISITAGEYKKVMDPARLARDPRGKYKYMKVHPLDPERVRVWDLGNPLTFNDALAGRFGEMRYGHGEGFNGAAVQRFKLFKTKAYLRTAAQAELHCVMVFAAMHGLTQRRRELETAGEFQRIPRPPVQRQTQAVPASVALAA